MQDQWYGDKRDLVKWGVLVELARRHNLKHILQVPYQRPSTWKRLEIDGQPVDLPQTVIDHFRNTSLVAKMQCEARVELVSETFADRREYLQLVLRRIRSRDRRPGIVFLDPDTGLEPAGVKGLQHVLENELDKIWHELSRGDFLVLYQHQTNRDGNVWIEPKKLQFEEALKAIKGTAKLAWAPEIARDVAFFFIEKGE